jgi:hypothetical protein
MLTNVTGAVYVRYDLMYAFHNYASAKKAGVEVLNPNQTKWWNRSMSWTTPDTLIPNIVRFDIYTFDYDGKAAMTDSSKVSDVRIKGRKDGMVFDSTHVTKYLDGSSGGISNVPPAAIDIYIQVASEDTAIEAGQLIASGNAELENRGREMLVRDSAVYFARAVPVTGPARYLEFEAEKPGHYYKYDD